MRTKLKHSSLIILVVLILTYLASPWWLVYLAKGHLPAEISGFQAEVSYPSFTQFEIQATQFELPSLGLQVKFAQLSSDYSVNEITIGSVSISNTGNPYPELKEQPQNVELVSNPAAVPFDLLNDIFEQAQAIESIRQLNIDRLTYTFPATPNTPSEQILIEKISIQQANGKIQIAMPLLHLPKSIQGTLLKDTLNSPSAVGIELDSVNQSLLVTWLAQDLTLGSIQYSKETDKETIQLKANSRVLQNLPKDSILDDLEIKDDWLILDVNKMLQTNRVLLESQSTLGIGKNSLNRWLLSSTEGSEQNKVTDRTEVRNDIDSKIDLKVRLNDSRNCTPDRACEFSLLVNLNTPLILSNSENELVADKAEISFDSVFTFEDITSSNSLFDLLQGEMTFSASKLLWKKTREHSEMVQSQSSDSPPHSSLELTSLEVKTTPTLPQASLNQILDGHWSIKAEASVGKLEASYSLDESQQQNNGATTNQISIRADAGTTAELYVINQEKSITNGQLELSSLDIDSTYGTAKANGTITWQELDQNFTFGKVQAELNLKAPKISDFTFDTAVLTATAQPNEEFIKGQVGLSFNEIPMSPVEYQYNKSDQTTAVLFAKEEVNLEVVNHLLSIVGEKQKIPLQILSGSLTHSGDVLLAKSAILSSQLDADKITVLFGENKVKGLKLKQLVTSIDPKVFKSDLQIESIDFSSGLQISEISAEIKGRVIDNKENLEFNMVEAKLLQGKLASKSIRFIELDMQPSQVDITELSLKELISFLDVPGLEALGTINLEIPMSSSDGQFIVEEGKFQSVGKGTIRYLTGNEQTQSEQNIVFQALENFHFDSFDGDISYDKDGQYRIKLHLLGRNPEFYDGYPIDFTLNLNGQLTGVFRSLFLTGNFEQAVLDQVEAQNIQEGVEP